MKNLPRRPAPRYLSALDELHGSQQARARQHFDTLSHDRKCEGVRRMADEGHGHYSISHATGISVEQIRAILGERRAQS